MNELLDKLHSHHLNALLEADRLCKKHNIRYYLVTGTLLGAVRHKGFIPWDDDLDIGLLRPDYERFLQVAQTELSDRFFLQTNATDPEYFLCYAKIRVNGTRFVEESSQNCNIHHGVYIDIFPLDNAPDQPALRRLHAFTTRLLSTAVKAKSKMVVSKNRKGTGLVYNLLKILTAPFRLGTLVKGMDKLMTISKNNSSECIVNINSAYSYAKECVKRSYFESTVELDFEGYKMSCPAGWHGYLTDVYRDYMTPPPEDKRYNRHSAVEYDL